MPSRDELIEALKAAIADSTDVFGYADIEGTTATLDGRFDMEQVADALLARWPHIAGPREVTTVEELAALPAGSLIRLPDGETGMVMVTRDKRHVIGYPGHLPTDELADVIRGACGDALTVLCRPDRPAST